MAFNFSDEDKQVKEYTDNIPFGVTEVQVTGAIADVNQNDKDFIEVGVIAESGAEDGVKLWFTGGASNISFNTLRQVAVHCAGTDEEKEAARQRIDKVKDGDQLAEAITEICAGKKVWFTKYYDGNRTYTNDYGTFKSTNKSIYGYEPKLKPELMPKDMEKVIDPATGGEVIDLNSGDAVANIPSDWAK